MPFVPEEDLNLHEDFQPIIAENGIIRPKKQEIPEDLMVSPDTTFTRMDTVQDLVQIRRAEQKAKEEKQKSESAQASSSDKKSEQKLPEIPVVSQAEPELELPADLPADLPGAHMQTISAQAFASETVLEQPAPPKQAAQPEQPAPLKTVEQPAPLKTVEQPEQKEQPVLVKESSQAEQSARPAPAQEPADLPTIRLIGTVEPKKRKSKKERRKSKAAKAAKAKEEAQPSAQQATPQTAQGPVALLPAPASKKRRGWVWALALICLLFLGTIGTVVPVEKIPLLRNIAYAMGFSQNDTSSMSFLRTLLAWTGKTLGLSGNQGESASVDAIAFERRSQTLGNLYSDSEEDAAESGLQARARQGIPPSSLIDMHALNALQRQRGVAEDRIHGSVLPNPGDETNPEATVELKDTNVTAQTEANQQTSDVFFGRDAFSINRDAQDGYDSINAFKTIANTNIAGVGSGDWLTTMAQRMMQANPGMDNINRDLSNMQLTWGTNIYDIGEDKPHRDMYHAWITSRMSKYTSNDAVKKALANAGFLGAEIPSTASQIVGYGGIQIDMVSLQDDQEERLEYLEFEKKCKEAVQNSRVDDAVKRFNQIVSNGADALGYPKNCLEALKTESISETFTTNTAAIQQVCKDLDSGYKALEEACHMQISTTQVACDSLSGSYNSSFEEFKRGCQAYYDQQKARWEQAWTAAHPGEALAPNAYELQQWPTDGELDQFSMGGETYGGSSVIFNRITNDGGQFATWVRASCTEDAAGNITCTAEDGEIERVQDTVGGAILKL